MLRAGRLRFAGLGDEVDESTERCELVHGDWSDFRVGGGGTVGDAEDLADVRPVISDWRTVKQNNRARRAGTGPTPGTTGRRRVSTVPSKTGTTYRAPPGAKRENRPESRPVRRARERREALMSF